MSEGVTEAAGYRDLYQRLKTPFALKLCAKFLIEDPDMETMKRELKDAFRLID